MRGAVLPVIAIALLAGGIVLVLGQHDPRLEASGPVGVARLADVSTVPLVVSVRMPDGAERLLQRKRTGHPCAPVISVGCPASTPVRPVTVFLVRDDRDALHAFIGNDPRNGCAIAWLGGQWMQGVFHDVCHGSLYDRRGQVVGGPSPWHLNELAIEVRGADVYVDPRRILTGGGGP